MATIKRVPSFIPQIYEYRAWQAEQTVCGIDEVGRGCLSGPVVAAAVILPPYTDHPLIKDSKTLTPKQRQKAYEWITTHAQYAVGITHHRIIDTLNIYHATLVAMKRAATQLLTTSSYKPQYILTDAMPLILSGCHDIVYFTHGEHQSSSIAAASIVAKVTRDRLMKRLDTVFPCYGLSHHFGYSTPLHKKELALRGATLLHRHSFTITSSEKNEQTELF